MLDLLRQHCRRIMLEIVLDQTLSADEVRSYVNSGAGVGSCYAAALELGLVSLRPGASRDWFRFHDLIVTEDVESLISQAEQDAYTIPLPLSAHDRIRLGAELRRLNEIAPAFPWIEPTTPRPEEEEIAF